MNYMPSQLADLHAAIDAFLQSKPCQVSTDDGRTWIDIHSTQYSWSIGVDLFRLKPEPKLRPWRADEVPVGQVIVFKEQSYRRGRHLIIASDGPAIYYGHGSALTAQFALNKCTMADGSPCGTTEP